MSAFIPHLLCVPAPLEHLRVLKDKIRLVAPLALDNCATCFTDPSWYYRF
jgi:hypothetical protein